MKKIYLILIILLLSGCTATNKYIPKGYIEKEEHYDKEGFQDYTDYAKYIYNTKDIVSNNKDYNIVTSDNIEDLTEYFNEFKLVMESQNRLKEYDFNINQITEGDYFKIITKEYTDTSSNEDSKFYNFSVYLFDTETLTLYYIHNNI